MQLPALLPALATPVRTDGAVDLRTLDRLVDFLFERGATGLCVGGATGEYPRVELAERTAVLRRAAARAPSAATLVAAIGGHSLEQTISLGALAFDLGCRAVLLPMPSFFRYSQEDLAAYASSVADALDGPVLLYDLPAFTNGLEASTTLQLIGGHDRIVGIKDSSGRLDHLARFALARETNEMTLMAGDDRYGLAAVELGWDGAISGLAACCPELLLALHRSAQCGDMPAARRFQSLVDELIAQVSPLPTPWGVRVALLARGIDTGPLPLPLSPARRAQIAGLAAWLPAWLEAADIPGLRPVRDRSSSITYSARLEAR